MGLRVKLCVCLLLTSAIVFSSASRNTISLSGEEIVVLAEEGRSLMASLEDYSEPTANPGHDPPSSTSRGGRGHGRKGG